ncbi:GNAT family N-acetyltransferase [Undibacterium sp. Di24W]|uniref:GNAT family N-acetyltransferase n=1 Tax=Undibacterium sp. Di24W TaxID=3413033 RepID=UPI003BF01BD3
MNDFSLTETLTVRRAQADDASALAQLARQTFIDTYSDLNDPEDVRLHCEKNFSIAQQADEINNPDYAVILIWQQQELIAFAQVVRRPLPDSAEVQVQDAVALFRYYVNKEWHGKGVAQFLMQAAEQAAREFAATHLWLGMWEHNARALAFYQKVGFAHVGWMDYHFGSKVERDYVLLKRL